MEKNNKLINLALTTEEINQSRRDVEEIIELSKKSKLFDIDYEETELCRKSNRGYCRPKQ